MKKLLALILAAMLIFSMVACSNKQTEDSTDDETDAIVKEDIVETAQGNYECDVNEDGDYEIVKYTPASVAAVDLVLPSQTADGRDISGIGKDAFKAQNSIKSVTIPSTYVYISEYAFYDCDSLTSVTISDSVESIAAHAFQACDVLATVTFSKGLTTLGEYAFAGCEALTAAELSTAVTYVGDAAFLNCKELKTVTLSDKVTTVYRSSFQGCEKLEYTVENYGRYLGTTDAPYAVLIGAEHLNIEECTVNNATKVVANGAFSNCPYLKTVTLGDAVAVINGTCFENSPALSFNEYENARYIGTANNPYMAIISVIISSVDGVHIHADTKIITDTAFVNCVNLRDISYPKSEADWNNIIKTELWDVDKTITVTYNATQDEAE